MNMSARPLLPQTSNISQQEFLDKVEEVRLQVYRWYIPLEKL